MIDSKFNDPRDITVGRGRIIYARATVDFNGNKHPEGWVLPGGQRTRSREIAETVAHNIDQITAARSIN
jgi:hypothetical protein